MSTYVLKRRYFSHGTFSELIRKSGGTVCVTAERPYLNNQPNVSCVPPGTYRMIPHNSNRFGSCYILESKTLGVGKISGLRTHILIHKGNTPSDVQGCIVPGEKFGSIEKNGALEWGVINSTSAFNDLMSELDGKEHTLMIEKA